MTFNTKIITLLFFTILQLASTQSQANDQKSLTSIKKVIQQSNLPKDRQEFYLNEFNAKKNNFKKIYNELEKNGKLDKEGNIFIYTAILKYKNNPTTLIKLIKFIKNDEIKLLALRILDGQVLNMEYFDILIELFDVAQNIHPVKEKQSILDARADSLDKIFKLMYQINAEKASELLQQRIRTHVRNEKQLYTCITLLAHYGGKTVLDMVEEYFKDHCYTAERIPYLKEFLKKNMPEWKYKALITKKINEIEESIKFLNEQKQKIKMNHNK